MTRCKTCKKTLTKDGAHTCTPTKYPINLIKFEQQTFELYGRISTRLLAHKTNIDYQHLYYMMQRGTIKREGLMKLLDKGYTIDIIYTKVDK